jgi:triosephosphate isomerase
MRPWESNMRRKLVAGNWKMQGRLAANASLISGVTQGVATLANVDVLVAPPAVYIAQVKALLTGSAPGVAAQNVAAEADGAFTGEVSAAMLADLGVGSVIIGHSERRTLYGETDAQVAAKFARVQAAGLLPILCVGETLAEREAGATLAVVGRQVDAVIAAHGVQALANSVLAYEPVWAIGTGRTASPEQAQEVHAALRAQVAKADPVVAAGLRILYGGSVKAANAATLFAEPDIDGALVGGASLVVDEFVAICRAAADAPNQ